MKRTSVLTIVVTTMMVVLVAQPVFAAQTTNLPECTAPQGAQEAFIIARWLAPERKALRRQVEPSPAQPLPARILTPEDEPLDLNRVITGVYSPDIDLVQVSADGRQLRVSGPIVCTKGEQLSVRATITQRSTGALADGQWAGTCTGLLQRWTIRQLNAYGAPSFRVGSAQACGLATTWYRGRRSDAYQWCGNVTVQQP